MTYHAYNVVNALTATLKYNLFCSVIIAKTFSLIPKTCRRCGQNK